ncbi:MAG: hypothetical protein JJE35_00155 [Thermoleophilia bacterium]|nr:hypothetical protein [Thermoleophilia bacterium]
MATKQPKRRKPRRKEPHDGSIVNYEQPVWEPLLGLARIYVDEFMWMGEIELDNGTPLQAYKHYWTRRYLHLDGEGNAWFYREDGRYEQLVDDIVHHFNLVVRWHYPGQHQEECEERLALHEERISEETRSGELAS